MSTPERRLDVLLRQRALVQQNLAWLDREIAAEEAQTSLAAPVAPATAPLSRIPSAAPISDVDAEAIISRYQHDEKSLTSNVRRGCLLYATGAFVLMIVVVFGLYFLLRH